MPKTFNYSVIALLLLLAVAAVIRFSWLGTVPKGVLVDEMHYGYLAWSILETGKDEHGVPFPLIFKGFGDDKLPGQVYSLVPFVSFFGLSNLTIKIPSALAGTFLVFAAYGLTSLFTQKKTIQLFSAGVAALLPWSIILSRHGFESNIALLFWAIGLFFSFRWLLQNTSTKLQFLNPILSSVFFALTWYFYIPYRPITALTLLFVVCIFAIRAFNQHHTKTVQNAYLAPIVVAIVTFLLLSSPFLAPSTFTANQTRINQVGILSDQSIANIVVENRTFCVETFPQKICYTLWNKPSVLALTLGQRWLQTYSPEYLATTGEGEIKYLTIQYSGQLQLVLYPLFLIGFTLVLFSAFTQVLWYFDFKNTKAHQPIKDVYLVLLFLLILGPIPAIFVGNPQPVRQSMLIPVVIICIALGAQWLLEFLKTHLKHTFLIALMIGIFSFGLLSQTMLFLTQIYAIHPYKNEMSYDSYLPDLFEFVKTYQENNPDTIIFTNHIISDPVMYYAYYTKIEPAEYQEKVVLGELEESGFQHAVSVANFVVSDKSPQESICLHGLIDKPNLFITKENTNLPIVYKAQSHHKVHTFAYVYELQSLFTAEDCEKYVVSDSQTNE